MCQSFNYFALSIYHIIILMGIPLGSINQLYFMPMQKKAISSLVFFHLD